MVRKLEDIYPLTIVLMRYHKTFVILNLTANFEICETLQEAEIYPDEIEDRLLREDITEFGFGSSVNAALENYILRTEGQDALFDYYRVNYIKF
jgi:hypothetical protein